MRWVPSFQLDGDPVIATKKGLNILDRGSQVHDLVAFLRVL
jgi:hypothetical protein